MLFLSAQLCWLSFPQAETMLLSQEDVPLELSPSPPGVSCSWVSSMLHILLSVETTALPELCSGFLHNPVGKILQGFPLSFQTEIFFQPTSSSPVRNYSSVCHNENNFPGWENNFPSPILCPALPVLPWGPMDLHVPGHPGTGPFRADPHGQQSLVFGTSCSEVFQTGSHRPNLPDWVWPHRGPSRSEFGSRGWALSQLSPT